MKFSAEDFYLVAKQLAQFRCLIDRAGLNNNEVVPPKICLLISNLLVEEVEPHCSLIGLNLALKHIGYFRISLQGNLSCKKVVHYFDEIERAIMFEVEDELFLHVPKEKAKYYESLEPLFGLAIKDKFPKASFDISEAGSCLALNRSTACVFHLMRVAEHGLRVLARRLGVKVKKKPIDYAEWEEILTQINAKVDDISKKPRGQKKTEMQEFYRGAWGEFTAFKDVWRNNVMHAHRSYDEHQALSVYLHVRDFMQRLAVKV
jgi:hypothetical protein